MVQARKPVPTSAYTLLMLAMQLIVMTSPDAGRPFPYCWHHLMNTAEWSNNFLSSHDTWYFYLPQQHLFSVKESKFWERSIIRLHHYHGEDYCFCHYFYYYYYYTRALFFLRFPPNFTGRDPSGTLLHWPSFIDLDLAATAASAACRTPSASSSRPSKFESAITPLL